MKYKISIEVDGEQVLEGIKIDFITNKENKIEVVTKNTEIKPSVTTEEYKGEIPEEMKVTF